MRCHDGRTTSPDTGFYQGIGGTTHPRQVRNGRGLTKQGGGDGRSCALRASSASGRLVCSTPEPWGSAGSPGDVPDLQRGGVARYQERPQVTATPHGATEVDLGAFVYRSQQPVPTGIQSAKFTLAVALVDGVDRAGRERLEAYGRRVQQAVEELLRTANSEDFEDPNLRGLKRQLQEQISTVLQVRVISAVIITDLVIERGLHPTTSPAEVAAPSNPLDAGPG
jgi:flagellar basal body-associated protein FliL